MWALQTCADSWPSVNNAAVSRTWPGSPRTLSFPWARDESTPTKDAASAFFIKIWICSSKETLNYLSTLLHCSAPMLPDRKLTSVAYGILSYCDSANDKLNNSIDLSVLVHWLHKPFLLVYLLCIHGRHSSDCDAPCCGTVISSVHSRLAAPVGPGSGSQSHMSTEKRRHLPVSLHCISPIKGTAPLQPTLVTHGWRLVSYWSLTLTFFFPGKQ